jgi:hypothetical protein
VELRRKGNTDIFVSTLLFDSIIEHTTRRKNIIFWYVMLYSLVEGYVSEECAASMLRFEEQAK